jgi:hypothetical protein
MSRITASANTGFRDSNLFSSLPPTFRRDPTPTRRRRWKRQVTRQCAERRSRGRDPGARRHCLYCTVAGRHSIEHIVPFQRRIHSIEQIALCRKGDSVFRESSVSRCAGLHCLRRGVSRSTPATMSLLSPAHGSTLSHPHVICKCDRIPFGIDWR